MATIGDDGGRVVAQEQWRAEVGAGGAKAPVIQLWWHPTREFSEKMYRYMWFKIKGKCLKIKRKRPDGPGIQDRGHSEINAVEIKK